MVDFPLSDVLTLVQTVAIISALLVTLYFSRRQAVAFDRDQEARVLSEIGGILGGIGQIFLDRPELIRVISNPGAVADPEVPFAYYILFFYSHIFHMRERGILGDNEWTGWRQWMGNSFRMGTVAHHWKNAQMESWFDPDFARFVNRELATSAGRPLN